MSLPIQNGSPSWAAYFFGNVLRRSVRLGFGRRSVAKGLFDGITRIESRSLRHIKRRCAFIMIVFQRDRVIPITPSTFNGLVTGGTEKCLSHS
jgi:hypothetical protein